MHRYLVVIEPTVARFSAYSPDVSGCIAAGATRAEVERAIREAIAFHLEGLRAEGQPLPPATTTATWVEVAAR